MDKATLDSLLQEELNGESKFLIGGEYKKVGPAGAIGAWKMGFTDLESAHKSLSTDTPELKGVMEKIGKLAVPTNNGDVHSPIPDASNPAMPVATQYDTFMAALGDKSRSDNKFMGHLGHDLNNNQALADNLTNAIIKNPDLMAREISSYTGNAGQLQEIITRVNSAPAPTAPSPAAQVAAAPASAPSSGVDYITAAAGLGVAALPTDATAAPAQASAPSAATTAAPAAMTLPTAKPTTASQILKQKTFRLLQMVLQTLC